MLFILLITIYTISCVKYTVELHEWEKFAIEFNQTCDNYFISYNTEKNEFIQLVSEGQNLSLYAFKNQSYIIFTAPLQTNFVFYWPEVTVNSIKMTEIENDHSFSLPLYFNYNEINCDFKGLATGSLMVQTLNADCEVYQCPETQMSWLKILLLCSIFVLGCILIIILYKLCCDIKTNKVIPKKQRSNMVQTTRVTPVY